MVYTIGGELYHHGVMGQKWGKRNGPPYPLKPEAHSDREKKFGYKKSIGGGRNEAAYEKNRKKVNRVEKKTANAQGSAKDVSKKKKGYDQEIREYNKAYKEANSKKEESDELWRQTKELRKKLGKNPIERTINAAKGKSKEAKEYSKMYDKASEANDKADELWRKAKEQYSKTGKTGLTRVINNAKYDLSRSSKKTANTQGSAREVPSEKKGLSDEQKKTLKKIAVGTAVVAGAALTAYAAYKYSPQIKSAARNGKEIAAKYMKTTLSSAKSKIANSKVVTKLNKAKKTVSNAANQVSQSTAAASQAASKTHLEVPKATAQKAAEAKASISLKFSEQAQDSAEINRKIIENNKKLQQAVSKTVMSQQSYVDEGEDLVAQMLKKNAKKLGM